MLYCCLFQSTLHPQKCWDKEQVCHDPGYGVAEADAGPGDSWHEPKADTAAGYHLHHAAEHGEVAEAEPLDRIAHDGEQSEGGVEVVVDAHVLRSVAHHGSLAAVYEELHHIVGEGIYHEEGEEEVGEHEADGILHATCYAVHALCSEVLSAVGSHCYADVLEDAGEEILYAERGGEGCYAGGAESVVGTLQHDDANAGDGELQAHRHTVVEQYARAAVVVATFVALRNEQLHVLAYIPYTQCYGYSLREPCGYAGSCYAHATEEYEHNVKQDVHEGGSDEEVERLARVAECAYLTRQEVEAEREWNGCELQHEERIGIVEDVSRSVHHLQDAVAGHQREHHYHRGYDSRHSNSVGYVDAHLAVVLRPERLRYGYGEACAGSVAEAHNEEGDGGGCAHGCQCFYTNPSAYDDGIDDEVHLLKDVAKYQWQCELCDLAQWRSDRHIAHRCSLLRSVRRGAVGGLCFHMLSCLRFYLFAFKYFVAAWYGQDAHTSYFLLFYLFTFICCGRRVVSCRSAA